MKESKNLFVMAGKISEIVKIPFPVRDASGEIKHNEKGEAEMTDMLAVTIETHKYADNYAETELVAGVEHPTFFKGTSAYEKLDNAHVGQYFKAICRGVVFDGQYSRYTFDKIWIEDTELYKPVDDGFVVDLEVIEARKAARKANKR